jgi:hypothetical protein
VDQAASGSEAPSRDEPSLEDVYDDATLAALDAWAPRRGAEPPKRLGRAGLAGLVLTSMALGLREALEGDDEEAIAEFRPEAGDPAERWVTFVHVPGAPAASRLVIRPWLAPL